VTVWPRHSLAHNRATRNLSARFTRISDGMSAPIAIMWARRGIRMGFSQKSSGTIFYGVHLDYCRNQKFEQCEVIGWFER